MVNNLVSLEWKGDPAEVYCPACGSTIYKMDFEGVLCSHVIFSYLDIIGNFDHIKSGWEDVAEEAKDKEEELEEEPFEIFMKSINSPGFFCLQMSTYGIGHGVTGSTVSIGIDFLADK